MSSSTPARSARLRALGALAVAALALAGCGSQSGGAESEESGGASASGATDAFPVSIENTFGTATIDSEPKRVATVAWTNQDAALAVGVLPVGMPKANYGDEDGDGYLPWVKDKVEELGGTGTDAPKLYDETDSIDFEAVSDVTPDVILAAQSGLSKEDYSTLSEIAPTVSFPKTAWGTSWRDTVRVNAKALGRTAQGETAIEDAEAAIATAVGEHPEIKGKKVAFLSADPSDLSSVSIYTTADARPQYLEDLGLVTADSVQDESAKTDQFYTTISSENADELDDVQVFVTYGTDALLPALQKDPRLSHVPAIADGAVAVLKDNSTLAGAASPSALSIPATVDEYAGLIAAAAAKAQ